MCSLISAPIPPCHHFRSFPPLCPYWVISISPSTLIFQPNHHHPPPKKKNLLEITLHLQIPSRDIRYLSAPLREKSHSYLICVWAEMAVMSPIIMTSVIRRAFDGLTVGRALHYCVKSKIIFGSCVTFFLKSFFFDFQTKKLLRIRWHLDTSSFVSILYCQRRERVRSRLKRVLLYILHIYVCFSWIETLEICYEAG